ncbi:MAG TPA: hybrid sensor histidine kinase/response regulator, partial [Marinilabiliaceae bacterium]|nr:hybrid sensor histidine kinase/response regulator [Marinilabiliaceae bacterium]
MKRYCFLIILIVLYYSAYAQRADNFFRRIDSGWGLSNNQVNTIFADSDGFLWLATVSGLNRYDSHSFKVFKNDPLDPSSLPENIITDIFEDHFGMLWLLTNNNCYIYNPELESFGEAHLFFDLNPNFTRNGIRSLCADGQGNTWIGNSSTGLWLYDGSRSDLLHLYHDADDADTPSSNRVMDVLMGDDGKVYVAHANGMVDVIDRTTRKVSQRIDMEVKATFADGDKDFRLFVDSDQHLWLYGPRVGEELYHYNPEQGQVLIFKAEGSGNEIRGVNISAVEEDDSGRIWVGTDHGGVYLLDKHTHKYSVLRNVPGDATSLSANSVTSLCKTDDGIIWVGTFKNGVNYYHPELFQFELYRTNPAIDHRYFSNDVNCFAEDSRGNLWIGTNDDGLVYFNRKDLSLTHYRHESGNPASLSNNVVVSLCMDHKGRLWVGTYQGGLNRFENGRFKRYMPKAGDSSSLADSRVWQIIEDKEKRLWVGTLGGGL